MELSHEFLVEDREFKDYEDFSKKKSIKIAVFLFT